MVALSWVDILKAYAVGPKKAAAYLFLAGLAISACLTVKWVHENGPELIAAHIMASNNADIVLDTTEAALNDKKAALRDCDAWARMSVREKRRAYRADPKRWGRCLCEGEYCELDRLYITGKLSR